MKRKKISVFCTALLFMFAFFLIYSFGFSVHAENEIDTAGSSLGKLTDISADDVVTVGLGGSWIEDENGWWYQYNDGSWPSKSWRKIDGEWYYFDTNGYWINDNRHEENSLKGIDVSAWQEEIDWTAVKNDGIEFAFIRLGHGVHELDKYYAKNMTGAANVGIPVGVYFYSTAMTPNDAVLDARYVVDNLEGYKVSYPVVIDLEDSSQDGLSKAEIGKIARVYCDEIQRAGYMPMIYMNEYWYSTHIDLSQVQGIDMWIARYNGTYNEAIPRTIWQSCNTGRVEGISGAADINFGYKDYTKYITPRTKPVSNYYSSRIPIGWQKDSTGWWYSNYDGSYPRNTWGYYGSWYYFDARGYMQTGWQYIEGRWYYLDESGRMATGWRYVNGAWYYMNSSGAMQTGWQYVNGAWYYMNASGVMQTGWQYLGGKWYYMNSSGVMQTGWRYVDWAWFYMNASGEMQTGWQYVNGAWYYMNASGAMQTGWQYLGGKWYYMNATGTMQTGWQNVGGAWYYMNPSGAMQTGWQYVGWAWFYMNRSGVMQTGWQYLNGEWYYLSGSGAMLTGQQIIDGTTYTFDSSGAML